MIDDETEERNINNVDNARSTRLCIILYINIRSVRLRRQDNEDRFNTELGVQRMTDFEGR